MILKISDAANFTFNSDIVLEENYREKYRPIHSAAQNFKLYCTLETLSLIFVLFRLINGMRVLLNFNFIVTTLIEAFKTLFIFIFIWFIFLFAMTPFAQAIWGHRVFGYKDFRNAHTSVMTIGLSKGSLMELMTHDSPYLFIFLLLYYSIAIFQMYGAAVMIQKDTLEQVVLRIGMNNGSFLDHSEPAPVLDRKAALKAKQSASVNLTIRLVSWTFGWMPRAAINSF